MASGLCGARHRTRTFSSPQKISCSACPFPSSALVSKATTLLLLQVFIYLVSLGPGCGMWNLLLRYMDVLVGVHRLQSAWAQ